MISSDEKGKPSRKPRFAAHSSVCIGGQKNNWCVNLTLFCKCGIVCMLLWCPRMLGIMWVILWASTSGGGGARGHSGRHQRLVVGSRPPSRITTDPSKMMQRPASNKIPALQNFAVDNKEAWARPGTVWACVPLCHNHGMSTLHVCVDYNIAPSRSVMVIE